MRLQFPERSILSALAILRTLKFFIKNFIFGAALAAL